MPFLVLVLLWLLNSGRLEPRYRNGIWSNAVLFVFLRVQEVAGLFWYDDTDY